MPRGCEGQSAAVAAIVALIALGLLGTSIASTFTNSSEPEPLPPRVYFPVPRMVTISISPIRPEVGEEMTFTVTVGSHLERRATFVVPFRVAGRLVGKREVVIPAFGSTTVIFRKAFERPGPVTLTIAGRRKVVYVYKPPVRVPPTPQASLARDLPRDPSGIRCLACLGG